MIAFRAILLLVAALQLGPAAPAQELAAIEAIHDMPTRSRRAVDFAVKQLDVAIDAYQEGNLERGRKSLDHIGDAAELAVSSLEATGKYPRRHPKHFKHAEIRTRRLARELTAARRKAHPEDHPDFERVIERIEAVNARLLLGIMGEKK